MEAHRDLWIDRNLLSGTAFQQHVGGMQQRVAQPLGNYGIQRQRGCAQLGAVLLQGAHVLCPQEQECPVGLLDRPPCERMNHHSFLIALAVCPRHNLLHRDIRDSAFSLLAASIQLPRKGCPVHRAFAMCGFRLYVSTIIELLRQCTNHTSMPVEILNRFPRGCRFNPKCSAASTPSSDRPAAARLW